MTDPTKLIRAGLDKGQAVTSNPTYPAPKLADLAGLRGDLPSIKTLTSAVIAGHAQIEAIRAATVDAIDQQTAKIRIVRHQSGLFDK